MSSPLRLSLEARTTGLTLAAIAAVLVVLHIATAVALFYKALPFDDWRYASFFDLDWEPSLGTWYAAVILLIAGQLLLLQTLFTRRAGNAWWPWWLVLCLGFHGMSLDEVAGFHEYLNTMLSRVRWTTVGSAIALIVAVAYLPFLRALPARTCWLFVLAGAIFIGGAIGVESYTVRYELAKQLNTLPYNMWTALEEGMEMAGVILFIYALLDHMARGSGPIKLELGFISKR
ncbi:MAG: hypothetical protein E4H01_08855 [Lysobacterales bacterium]|nr:MAG: hypothetical protein E4H01_08855 [Xanthomonadales bacterium]